MATKIQMPKLGLTMTEGTVVKWHKAQGDPVKAGDLLFEVETDKLTNEVRADCEGVLLSIVAQEGAVVPCTGAVAFVGEPGEAIVEAADTPKAEEKPSAPAQSAAATPAVSPVPPASGGYVLASPAAKKLAKERGVDLALVTPSGPDGAVVLKDVEAYAQKPASGTARKIARELGIDLNLVAASGRVMAKDVLLMAAAREAGTGEADEARPMSGMRKTIAARMLDSWHTSPRVWYEHAVDTTAMQRLRSALKPRFAQKGLKLTYNHIIMLAAVRALAAFPQVNASVEGDALLMHPHVNLGLAVSVENGLLVPNVKCCELLSLEELAVQAEALVEKARTGSLGMDELSGGTFTITNIGSFGTRSFSPIINQPELAILGVSAIMDTPVVQNGAVVIRPMMNLDLVADHRVIDGVVGAAFLKCIVDHLEEPGLLL